MLYYYIANINGPDFYYYNLKFQNNEQRNP